MGPGETGRGSEAGPPPTKIRPLGTLPALSCTLLQILLYTPVMPAREGHITLNFSPVFLGRLRDYAKAKGMKVNAVLKKAFEYLEDHEAASVQPKVDRNGRDVW